MVSLKGWLFRTRKIKWNFRATTIFEKLNFWSKREFGTRIVWPHPWFIHRVQSFRVARYESPPSILPLTSQLTARKDSRTDAWLFLIASRNACFVSFEILRAFYGITVIYKRDPKFVLTCYSIFMTIFNISKQYCAIANFIAI